MFEADNAQARSQVASSTAFAGKLEALAIGFETRDVAECNVDTGAFSDPIADTEKAAACLGRECDGSAPQRRALRRPLKRARASAKTLFAGIRLEGSALDAS